MNHGKTINHLSRKKGHRRAVLMNMANALIKHKRINTTLAKAKALRRYAEPLITKSKKNNMHSRRVVYGYLQDKSSITELFDTIGPKVMERPGGYLRVIKLGFRPSDGAEMAMIEFVDFNEVYDPSKGRKKTRRSRRGGGGRKKSSTQKKGTQKTAASEEE